MQLTPSSHWRPASRNLLGLTSWLLCFGPVQSSLSQSAEVIITHDDADSVVLPGETVTISMRHVRTSGLLCRLSGDVVATPGLGTASEPWAPQFTPWAFPSNWYIVGTTSGPDVRGVSAYWLTPPFFQIGLPHPLFLILDQVMVNFSWTAPEVASPTPISFDFRFDPLNPELLLFPTILSMAPVAVPVTLTGATLTVLPAPATLLAIVPGLALVGGSRRRTPR